MQGKRSNPVAKKTKKTKIRKIKAAKKGGSPYKAELAAEAAAPVRKRGRDDAQAIPDAEEYLFGRGQRLEHYFLRGSPGQEVIHFLAPEGREYVMLICNDTLARNAVNLLKERGVRIIDKQDTQE